ncbi:hypothetical protein [Paraburkholderia gardini]|uniref:AlpA family transcriptional regulator n=1 Tax=Paraburkholderia gardini TaxID=2823469 RepID=A0ABN7QQQ3_9BURK|nr:hypothetical protein [Paraburkholderia gardini]CAG4920425.1 hypothetical protein R54767_04714 [Paraburkholderia gardini]
MAVQFVAKKKRTGGTRPKTVITPLNQPGRLRVGHLLTLLSISATTFYRRLNAGVIPEADGSDGKPYWKTETVRAFLESGK